MKFIQAKNWKWANRSECRLIVIHTMENPEKPNSAEAVAAWFGSASAPMASAHVCIDNDSIVECVKPEHVAFGAPSANKDGYHLEHAGRAAQTAEQWADEYSMGMLRISAKHAAAIAMRFGIPVVKLTPEQVGDKVSKGFCGHVDVTNGFKTPGGHVDPGKAFPWDLYLRMVEVEISASSDTERAPPPESVS